MTGDELKALRLGLALSQAGLARHLGVQTQAVSRWEQGVRAIRPPMAILIRQLATRRKRLPEPTVNLEAARR